MLNFDWIIALLLKSIFIKLDKFYRRISQYQIPLKILLFLIFTNTTFVYFSSPSQFPFIGTYDTWATPRCYLQAQFCWWGLVGILWPPVSRNNSHGEELQQMEGTCGFSLQGMKRQPFLSSGDSHPLQNSISKKLAKSLNQKNRKFSSCLFCCCSVAESYSTLCDPPWTAKAPLSYTIS